MLFRSLSLFPPPPLSLLPSLPSPLTALFPLLSSFLFQSFPTISSQCMYVPLPALAFSIPHIDAITIRVTSDRMHLLGSFLFFPISPTVSSNVMDFMFSEHRMADLSTRVGSSFSLTPLRVDSMTHMSHVFIFTALSVDLFSGEP